MSWKGQMGLSEKNSSAKRAFVRAALPVPLRKTFDYSVPERLSGLLTPGMRVLADFAGRRLCAIVTEVAVTPSHDEAKIRDLAELVEEEPSLGPELMALGHWLSDYYHHPLGEALFTLLPPSARKGDRVYYEVSGRGAGGPLSPEALELFRKIESAGKLPAVKLAAKSLKAIDELFLSGAITRGFHPLAASRARGQRWAYLAPGAPSPEALAGNSLKLSGLLSLLSGGPKTLLALKGDFIGADTVKRAVEKGWVMVSEEPPQAAGAASFGSGEEAPGVTLNEAQEEALRAITGALDGGAFSTLLLKGVTGSGKTEVYILAALAALKRGRSTLCLAPEISLTPQLVGRFAARLGQRFAVLHSGLSESERGLQWEAVKCGRARVVVGTRSAVFAPLANLGLIIVDEEHEGSFKQEEGLRYNAKHVALVRSQRLKGVALLGSATPDLESYHHALNGRYRLLTLPERATGAMKPSVKLVDLRQEEARLHRRVLIGERLKTAVDRCLERGEQALIFLNRRGYAPAHYCTACGQAAQCPDCSVPFTYHTGSGSPRLVCHYCGRQAKPAAECSLCGSTELMLIGAGTQKVEETVEALWPTARVLRLDRDAAGKDGARKMLTAFRSRDADILVGTQMVAKGHHFPHLTVVGVISADDSLSVPDYRAAERTFQTLAQVAGRAGREAERPGEVYLQTRNPGHPALRAVAEGSYEGFAEEELSLRLEAGFPPFGRLALLKISATSPAEGLKAAREVEHLAKPLAARYGLALLGPAPAPIEKQKGRFRFHLLIKGRADQTKEVRLMLKAFFRSDFKGFHPDTRLSVDVDPVSLV